MRILGKGILFVGLAACAAGPLHAVGFGGSVQGEGGSTEWTLEPDMGPDLELDSDVRRGTIGFVMDTVVAGNELFNYRLNAALGSFDVDFELFSEDLELRGLTADNYFGFGVFRSESVRLWVGPMARIGFYVGEIGREDALAVEFAAGGALGVNIHTGNRFSLGITAGFVGSGFAGFIGDIDDDDEEDFTGEGGSAFISISFLGRLSNDHY